MSLDALLQFAAIGGHRVVATDVARVDRDELDVMRRAAELLPIERWIEHEKFGVATA